MNFNPEQIRIIKAAQPIWEGYLKSQTINTGQREIADLRAVYAETLGLDGKYPEWSPGCIACVTNAMSRIFAEAEKQLKLDAAAIASDEQPKAKKAAPKAKKK